MADSDLEFQQSSTWMGIWNRATQVFRFFLDRTGFQLEEDDGSQKVRARLKIDSSNTRFEMLSSNGMSKLLIDLEGSSIKLQDFNTNRAVEITASSINFYDETSSLRRKDLFTGITNYASNATTVSRQDLPTGSVLNDPVSGDERFSFNVHGIARGQNGAHTWTIDPSLLSSDARFAAKAECDVDGNNIGNKNYLAES